MSKSLSTPIEAASSTETFALVNPWEINPDPRNVRDGVGDISDLANSIFQVGLQQPLRIRLTILGEEFGVGAGTQAFVVIAGHRRLAAIHSLLERGLWEGDVPCMIAPESTTDDDVTASMIVENLQRQDLNPIEEGKAFQRLLSEFKYKRADLAVKISRSESYVGDRLALIKLPQSIQDSIAAGHYPMSHALLLKGVPAAIVEDITKGGRKVVTDEHTIHRAVSAAKYSELKQAFEKALQAIGVEVVVANRYEFQNVSTEVASFTTLDDAKLLAKYDVPKGVKAVLNDSPYSSQISVELRKPMTPKQIEDLKAKRTEQYTAEQLAREQLRRDRYEAERANWSPEYQAWVDECDALKAEHVAAIDQHEEASEAAVTAWAESVDAKLVAKWAMTDVINKVGWHRADAVIDHFDIPVVDDEDASDAIHTYVMGDAKALVKVVAFILALDHDQAHENQTAFLRKQNIPPAPELILPPEPANTKEDTDGDPLDDVA